jgi:hypothetical protein
MKLKPPVIIGIAVGLIVIAFIVFAITNPAVATRLGLTHTSSMPAGNTGTTTPRQFGVRGGFVTGSIEVLNDNGFTLTLSDGTTKDIDLTATTTIQNFTSTSSTPTTITSDQLSVGEQVQVIGSPEDDGSINARFVRTGTLPTMHAGGQGRGPSGAQGFQNGTPPTQ